MPPTQVLIPGNAKRGTPLMLAAPSVALDLPLRVLVRDDCQGSTRASFHTAAELESAHSLPAATRRWLWRSGWFLTRWACKASRVIYLARPLFGLIRYFSPVARLL